MIMSAMDLSIRFILGGYHLGAAPFLRTFTRDCNFVQNGHATLSIFALQLWVILFYNKQYTALTSADIKTFSKESDYEDLQNTGNIAKEQKYIYTEKNPETNQKEEKSYNRYQAYELSYCLQNVEDGLTENLYKAYIVASNHNLLGDTTETNWELGLTKEYALETLTTVLEDTGAKVSYDRGESKGEVVLDDVNKDVTESEVIETETNGQLENTEVVEQYAEGTYYYTENEDGSREYSPYLITDCMGTEAFAGLTEEEIKLVLDVYLDKYDTTDKEIRETIKYISRDNVRSLLKLEGIIIDAETPNTSDNSSNTGTPTNQTGTTNNQTGTSNNNSSTESTASGGSSITPEVQPTTPSVQPTTPSTEPTLTQEQQNELYGPGGLLENFYNPTDLGNSTGEKCEDFINHN